MKAKKKIICVIACTVSILGAAITAEAASASTALTIHDKKVQTSSIGLAKKATAEVWNSKKSNGKVTAKVYAAWAGYPYTCEQTNTLAKGGYGKYVEKQSKSSSFKLQLKSGGGVAALGKIYY